MLFEARHRVHIISTPGEIQVYTAIERGKNTSTPLRKENGFRDFDHAEKTLSSQRIQARALQAAYGLGAVVSLAPDFLKVVDLEKGQNNFDLAPLPLIALTGITIVCGVGLELSREAGARLGHIREGLRKAREGNGNHVDTYILKTFT